MENYIRMIDGQMWKVYKEIPKYGMLILNVSGNFDLHCNFKRLAFKYLKMKTSKHLC
jgi:hypothetical protein